MKCIRSFLKAWRDYHNRLRPEDIERELNRIYDERSRDVVMRLSRGNHSLMMGQYVTAQELDREFGRHVDRDRS
jgi:hypothetical protein